jgi:hypothetical protein
MHFYSNPIITQKSGFELKSMWPLEFKLCPTFEIGSNYIEVSLWLLDAIRLMCPTFS